jgi:hypothetical protein
MPGKICIITPTGMICEATSYEYHYPVGSRRACKKIPNKKPRTIKARVAKLMSLAGVRNTPFMIFTKP